MDTQAIMKYQRISAQKCRLVANAVKGLKVDKAFDFLNFDNKKASRLMIVFVVDIYYIYYLFFMLNNNFLYNNNHSF